MTRDARATSSPKPTDVSWQSAAPVVVFLIVNRMAGLRWAVASASAASIGVTIDRRRKGLPLGRFMPVVTAAVILRGLAGIITGSETVYFGLGIATKYVVAAVLIGSVLLGTPLATRAAPLLMRVPDEMAAHRLFRSTMAIITVVAGFYYVISATFDIWLFRRSSVEGFVFLRFVANWPLSAATLLLILAVLQVRLQRIPGVPPVAVLVEQRRTELTNDRVDHAPTLPHTTQPPADNE